MDSDISSFPTTAVVYGFSVFGFTMSFIPRYYFFEPRKDGSEIAARIVLDIVYHMLLIFFLSKSVFRLNFMCLRIFMGLTIFKFVVAVIGLLYGGLSAFLDKYDSAFITTDPPVRIWWLVCDMLVYLVTFPCDRWMHNASRKYIFEAKARQQAEPIELDEMPDY